MCCLLVVVVLAERVRKWRLMCHSKLTQKKIDRSHYHAHCGNQERERGEKRSLLPQPVPFSMENVTVTSLDLDIHLDGWPLRNDDFSGGTKGTKNFLEP